jgi:dienelactone hydrolase
VSVVELRSGPGARRTIARGRGGVVVIHHLPGYDRATKEIVRRFAELGYDALTPNLYSREGLDVPPEDAAAAHLWVPTMSSGLMVCV